MKLMPVTAFLIVIFLGSFHNFSFAVEEQNAWQQMKGQDLVIYYRATVPEDFVQTTMDTSEEEIRRVTDNFGITKPPAWSGDRRIKIYIYNDRDDYVKNGGQAAWSHGVAFSLARTIKTWPSANGFFDTILPHELGHIIFRNYIGFKADLPLWFEEGVAIYQEKAKRLGAEAVVKEALQKDKFIPLSQLTGMRLYKNSNNEVVDLFYAESASAFHYLITEYGEQEFYMLCEDIKAGIPFEEALHKVYLKFRTVSDLSLYWQQYLQG